MAIEREERETFRGHIIRGASYSWLYSPIFISCFLGVVAVLSILSVHQSRQIAMRTYHIQELLLEKRELQRANAKLSCEIARLEALPLIEAKAHTLGLAPAEQVNYVAMTAPRQTEQITAMNNAFAALPEEGWMPAANIGESQPPIIATTLESPWWHDLLAVFTDWTNPPQAAAAPGIQ